MLGLFIGRLSNVFCASNIQSNPIGFQKLQTDPIQLALTIQTDPIQLDWIGSVWMIGFGFFWADILGLFLGLFLKEYINIMCQLQPVMRS